MKFTLSDFLVDKNLFRLKNLILTFGQKVQKLRFSWKYLNKVPSFNLKRPNSVHQTNLMEKQSFLRLALRSFLHFPSQKVYSKKLFKIHPIQVKPNWNATSKTAKICSTTLCMHISRVFLKWSGIYFKTKSEKSTKWMTKQFSAFFAANHTFIRLEAKR